MPRSVVIIGAGQGGLVAAIYARLAGYDVLVLEKSDQIGGKAASIQTKGFRLDPGPSIVILPKIYRAVFKDAGREMSNYLTFNQLDPISQVRFEGEEFFNLPAHREVLIGTVRDRHPADGKALWKLLNKLDGIAGLVDDTVFQHPFEKPWQLVNPKLMAMATRFDVRATYRELVDKWFTSPLLRAFFYGFPSYGGQTYDSKAPGALLIPYFMIQEGVFYPEGGVGAIPNAFARLARELGVEFRTGSCIESLHTHSNSIKSLTLTNGWTIDAEFFISNVDRATVRSWFSKVESAPPSFSYFTVHWGFRGRVPGLEHHTLLVPKDFEQGFEGLYRSRQFPTPPIVYLNETSATDRSVAPIGGTNLFAVVTSPAREEHIDWPTEEPRFIENIIKVMGRLGVDLPSEPPVFRRVQTPVYFEREHGNYRGSLYGVDEKSRPFSGLFPYPNRDPDFKNLFYCGGSVQPGAGLPMVTLSGKFAAGMLPK
jgi:phytoene desaturase